VAGPVVKASPAPARGKPVDHTLVVTLCLLQLKLFWRYTKSSTSMLVGSIVMAVMVLGSVIPMAVGLGVMRITSAEIRGAALTIGFALLTLMWPIVVTLMTGSNDMLDAGRFALFPVKPARLLPGLLAAAAMGLGGLMTALLGIGYVVAWSTSAGSLIAAIVGLAIGYVARLMFVGVEIGAFHISQQMGLSLAEVYGGEERADPMRPLLHLLALVIFLSVGGHRMMLSAVVRSFDTLPPLALTRADVLDVVAGLLGASFMLALKVAAPVLLAMLLAGVLLGLLQRTAPTLSILSVGLPVRVLLGLLLVASMLALGTLPALLEWASRQVGTWMDSVAWASRP